MPVSHHACRHDLPPRTRPWKTWTCTDSLSSLAMPRNVDRRRMWTLMTLLMRTRSTSELLLMGT